MTTEELGVGRIVRINNHDHVWYGEIAIVRGVNNIGFRRIELLGKLVWVPKHWLEPSDDNKQTDDHG